jgi:hypothetical protein
MRASAREERFECATLPRLLAFGFSPLPRRHEAIRKLKFEPVSEMKEEAVCPGRDGTSHADGRAPRAQRINTPSRLPRETGP